MSQSTRQTWDDAKVADELRLVVDTLGHFPSSTELREMGRNDLACQISRRGGFVHWSERLGVSRQHSDSDTGWIGEAMAAVYLREAGFAVSWRSTVKWPFDLLVDDVLRLDVKAARRKQYDLADGWFFRIGKVPQADLIFLWRLDVQDFFAIPWFACPNTSITISQSGGKYRRFHRNVGLIREMRDLRLNERHRVGA